MPTTNPRLAWTPGKPWRHGSSSSSSSGGHLLQPARQPAVPGRGGGAAGHSSSSSSKLLAVLRLFLGGRLVGGGWPTCWGRAWMPRCWWMRMRGGQEGRAVMTLGRRGKGKGKAMGVVKGGRVRGHATAMMLWQTGPGTDES